MRTHTMTRHYHKTSSNQLTRRNMYENYMFIHTDIHLCNQLPHASPWYDLRSWLGVKNQLSINLSTVDYLFWINKTNWVAPGIEPGSLVRKVNLFVMTCIHLSAFASKYKWLLCSHPSPYGAPFAPNLHSATGLIFLVAQVVTGRSTGIRFRLDEIRVDEIRVD